ncbi:hypothetical protein BASA60_001614 [Batrachochytrium salamandrivorans]|nr:hypothetical protein BASA60_001614 [Batrachochytrium salamandrivorans]KAH9268937.1 hypothetical protein BASA83_009071 [Batrachochytrium salamandrivorans]
MGNLQSVSKFVAKTRQKQDKEVIIKDIALDPKWFPAEVAFLNLERVCLINVALPYVPDILFQLITLSHLKITESDITSITGIGSLIHLKSLIVHSNAIDWIPDDFVKLTQLEELDVHDNRISSRGILPEMYLMQTIRSLDISGNRLTLMPAEFAKFGMRLREIQLHDNPWVLSEMQELSLSSPLPSHDTRSLLSSIVLRMEMGDSNYAPCISLHMAPQTPAIALDKSQTDPQHLTAVLETTGSTCQQKDLTKPRKHGGSFFGRRSSDAFGGSSKPSSDTKPNDGDSPDSNSKKDAKKDRKPSKTVAPNRNASITQSDLKVVERTVVPLAPLARAHGPRGRKPPSIDLIQRTATGLPSGIQSITALSPPKGHVDSTPNPEHMTSALFPNRPHQSDIASSHVTLASSPIMGHTAKMDETDALNFKLFSKKPASNDLMRKNAVMHSHKIQDPAPNHDGLESTLDIPNGPSHLEPSKHKLVPKGGFSYMGGALTAGLSPNLPMASKMLKTTSAIALEASERQSGLSTSDLSSNPIRPPVLLPPKPSSQVHTADSSRNSSQTEDPLLLLPPVGGIQLPKSSPGVQRQPSSRNGTTTEPDVCTSSNDIGMMPPKKAPKPIYSASTLCLLSATSNPPPVIAASPASMMTPSSSIQMLAFSSALPEANIAENLPPPVKLSNKPSRSSQHASVHESPLSAQREYVGDVAPTIMDSLQQLSSTESKSNAEPLEMKVDPTDLKVRPKRAETMTNSNSTTVPKMLKTGMGLNQPSQSSPTTSLQGTETEQRPTAAITFRGNHSKQISESYGSGSVPTESQSDLDSSANRSFGKEIVVKMETRRNHQLEDLPAAPKLPSMIDRQGYSINMPPKNNSMKLDPPNVHLASSAHLEADLTHQHANGIQLEPQPCESIPQIPQATRHSSSQFPVMTDSGQSFVSSLKEAQGSEDCESGITATRGQHERLNSAAKLKYNINNGDSVTKTNPGTAVTTATHRRNDSFRRGEMQMEDAEAHSSIKTNALLFAGSNRISGVSRSMDMLSQAPILPKNVAPPELAPKPGYAASQLQSLKQTQDETSIDPSFKVQSQAFSARLALQGKLSPEELCTSKYLATSTTMLSSGTHSSNTTGSTDARSSSRSFDNLSSDMLQRTAPPPAFSALPSSGAPLKPPKPRTPSNTKGVLNEAPQTAPLQPSWKKQTLS